MVVNYKRTVRSRAMNKAPDQVGLSITKDFEDNVIRLECINKKLKTITTDLYLEIPIEQIDNVINALKQVKYERENKEVEQSS